VRIGKRAFYEQMEMNLAEAYEYASAVMVRNMMDEDAAEGIDAFLEKRRPAWRELAQQDEAEAPAAARGAASRRK
jgi:1,4-dihydroxy-2-naphthoyl-CoA synthase